MSRLTRDGTAEPVSQDQIVRRERGQGNMIFPCSADHEQDSQPYPVDPYSCYMCDHTYMIRIWEGSVPPLCDPPLISSFVPSEPLLLWCSRIYCVETQDVGYSDTIIIYRF